jgi:putative sigma-54 modulation protein
MKEGGDMDLTIRTRGDEVPLKVRRYAERRAAKLERYFRELQRLELLVGEERGICVAELTLEGDGTLLRSQERNADLHAAIGSAIGKAERQALRFKAKMRDERRRAEPDETGATVAEEEPEEFMPVVARRKRYAMKPMSEEEAARHMELIGHDFYLFRHVETGEISALYRRHDGNYGLIEPDA